VQNSDHGQPGEVSVESGYVVLHVPDGSNCIFTPDAAVITSDRLLEAGLRAKRAELDSQR